MSNDTGNKPKWRKYLNIFLVTLLLIAAIAIYFTYFFTYSEGNRAGVLIKFSKKGYVFKTYEGELNVGGMGNLPNTAQMNQIWLFSVSNQAVADSLMLLEGKKVSLHYNQVEKPLPWNGETTSYVDGFKVLGN
jgi:hypothetical protein